MSNIQQHTSSVTASKNEVKKYSGVIVPTVTPLEEGLRLDQRGLENIFSNLYHHNISPFILGTTGESASFSIAFKKAFVQKAAAIKAPDTMLYAGIAANCFDESVELAKHAFDHGIDAVAATLPSYYALNNDQVKRYFEQLADAVAGPLIIYNIPATTHMSIPLDIIDELSHHENIVATKDSERSDERLKASIALWKDRKDFSHFLGWAARSAQALMDGSDGLVPSTGNLNGEIYRLMVTAVQSGDHDNAMQLQQSSDVLGSLYQGGKSLGESLWALKVLMEHENICKEFVMPPLQGLSGEEKQKLITGYQSIKL